MKWTESKGCWKSEPFYNRSVKQCASYKPGFCDSLHEKGTKCPAGLTINSLGALFINKVRRSQEWTS